VSTRSGNLVDSIRRSIVRRVSLSIIVTVLAIGTVAMAAIICWHYQRQYDDFESSTSNVTNAYSSAIAGAMWHFDTSQLNLLADGIQKQESVSYVRINDRGALNIERGIRPYHRDIQTSDLLYNGTPIGQLEIAFNRESVFSTTIQTILPSLIALLVGLSLFGIILVVILQRVVSSRIQSLALEVRDRLENNRFEPLSLQPSSSHDEIDSLIRTFNKLSERILDELQQKTVAQQQLSVVNLELEDRVKLRTYHLQETVTQLNQTLIDLNTTQSKLIEAEKLSALGGMIAAIGHEIETPLGLCLTVQSCLKNDVIALKRAMPSGAINQTQDAMAAVDESLAMLDRNLKRSAELMKGFKEVSAGQIGDDRQRISLLETIQEVVAVLTPKLRQTKHTINIDCASNLMLQGSATAISQVLTNLIMNSLTHGFHNIDEGEIRIQAGENHEWIILRYSDNGVGMSDETKQKIFEPLYTTLRGKGGTGLGMHLVYNIIRQRLKGDITLEESDVGVVFRMQIPKQKRRQAN